MFRKSSKHIIQLRKTRMCILIYLFLSLLGVIFAGNNVQAFEFPATKWNIGDQTQSPGLFLNNVCYRDSGYSHNQGIYYFFVYKNTDCSGNFTIYNDQIIVVTISGYTGFIDLADGAEYLTGTGGISFMGVEPRDTGAGTVYDLYFRGTSSVNTPLKIQFKTTRSGWFAVNSVVTYNYVSDDYNTDLSTIIAHLQTISSSITDVYIRLGGVASNVSNIATNVSDIETILNDLGSDMSDIADNSDETLQTNKTEKSSIENQTPQNAGLEGDYSKTTSLITAVSTVVSDLGNISAGDSCVISGNLGNWDGVGINMGDLDLCSLPVPVYVSTGLSLVLVVILVGLMISLVRLMIATFYATVPTGA